jgi:hypothetical protein
MKPDRTTAKQQCERFWTLPQKAILQAPALEVILEFPLDIVGQWPALRSHHVHEDGIVLLNELLPDGLFRTIRYYSKFSHSTKNSFQFSVNMATGL